MSAAHLERLIRELVIQAQSDYSRTLDSVDGFHADRWHLSDQSYETISEFVKTAGEGTFRDELVSAIIDVTDRHSTTLWSFARN